MSETQDLYSQSDLVPFDTLFEEMGNDRSFWRQIGEGINKSFDYLTLGIPAALRRRCRYWWKVLRK